MAYTPWRPRRRNTTIITAYAEVTARWHGALGGLLGVLSSAVRARIAALEAELAEARALETATAEVLKAINASRGDLAPVFDAILGKALTLSDATLAESRPLGHDVAQQSRQRDDVKRHLGAAEADCGQTPGPAVAKSVPVRITCQG
jgi:hypothetical protein